MGEGIRTLVRAVICFVAVWALEAGSYTIPVSPAAALLVATVVGVLIAYELAIRDISPVWLAAFVMAIFVVITGGFFVYRALQPPPPTGPLRPAHEPTPNNACRGKADPGDLVMLAGSDTVIGKGAGPFTPYRLGECPFLSLTRTKKGLTVNDAAYDYDNDVAFMIRNEVYQPLQILELRVLRPDPSTFVLLDRFNQEVIYVRYLNPGAVRIRGRILCGEAPQAVIQDDRILLGGIRIGGVTSGQHRAPGHGCTIAPSPAIRTAG